MALATAVRRPSRDAAVAVMSAPPPIVRHEPLGSQLLAASGHVRQADEDQILEGLTDSEQIDARHARKV
jgi:hypothetical protein